MQDIKVFEFINVDDKDARRLARSHITREINRRQRDQALRFQQVRNGGKKVLMQAPEKPKAYQTHSKKSVPINSQILLLISATPKLPAKEVVAISNVQVNTPTHVILEPGRLDAFRLLPPSMKDSRDFGLVDHCKSGPSGRFFVLTF